MRVQFVDLAAQEAAIAPEVLEAVARVAVSGQFVLGPEVGQFERWLAGACGAPHAIGVASGTDALELALRGFGIGAGDAVVTPALSFIAAAEAIALTGARPVFCDVDRATLNASAETVEHALRRVRLMGLRARAVLPVHLFGACAPLAKVRALATDFGFRVVEDAAQALGALDEAGDPPGSRTDAACFSFFPTKPLGAWGDGGAVVTQWGDVAARVRSLRAHGARAPFDHTELGRNSRLDTLQAAVLLTKARCLGSWQRARSLRAERYSRELSRLPLTLPRMPEGPSVHAWHAYVVRTEARDALAHWLNERGVLSRVYYPIPLHRQACFESLAEPGLPEAEAACRTALALPLYAAMTEAQQAHVIEQVAAFFATRG